MADWEYTEVLVTAGDDGPRVLVDGREAQGPPERVLADLWEQGWEMVALWTRPVAEAGGWREVAHQARLRRRRPD